MGWLAGTPGVIRWATALSQLPARLDAPTALIIRAEAMANFPPAPPGVSGESALRRRALAALTARVLGVHPAVRLVADAEGRRRLDGLPGVFASVAARDGWTAAALAREPIGIDVEAVAEAEAGRDTALDSFDGDLIDWHGPAGVWAAKEAALKLHGRGIDTPARWHFGAGGQLALDSQAVLIGHYALPGAAAAVAVSTENSSRAAPAASSAPIS